MPESDKPNVYNATDQTFELEVFERSRLTPVIVDFWATWCQPCLMLAPILEKLAEEYEGRFALVKAETSEAAQAAANFNVSSIPALFAVVEGEVIDMLAGGLPEPQLREWIERILTADDLQAANRLEDSDAAAAAAKYRKILEVEPDSDMAKIGLARTELALGNQEEAANWIERLEARGFLEPEAEKVKAALQFAAADPVDLGPLQAAADANPDDLQASLDLATALASAGQHEAALERALTIVQRDKKGVGEPARQLMVDIFRALPDESELTSEFRRKLSMALY